MAHYARKIRIFARLTNGELASDRARAGDILVAVVWGDRSFSILSPSQVRIRDSDSLVRVFGFSVDTPREPLHLLANLLAVQRACDD